MKWGFIGCGDVVEKKSGKPFVWEEKSEVQAVMCRTLESAKTYANNHEIAEFYDDANQIIYNDEIDAIYIATPPSTHISYAKQAILAGKPVYIEKPMGLNTAECEALLSLAKDKNIPVFVAFYRRGLPMFQEIKSIIESGAIGDIRFVGVKQYKKIADGTYEWRRDPAIAGGGLFHDLACHTLDILDYLIAPIEEAGGFSGNQRELFSCDDIVTTSFRFANGVLGTGVWCFDVDQDVDEVEIIGNQGKLQFAVFENHLKIVCNGVTEERTYNHPKFIQEPMIHNVIDSILEGKTPLSTGDSALRTVQVMDQILGICGKV